MRRAWDKPTSRSTCGCCARRDSFAPSVAGPFIYYCLADPELLRILHDLKQWLEARQGSASSEGRQSSKPAKRHSALARTKEV